MILFTQYDKWRRDRSCTRKRRYSYREAKHLAELPCDDGKYRRAYLCAYCGFYHVGGTRGFETRDPNEWPEL